METYELNFNEYAKILFSIPIESEHLENTFKDSRKNFSNEQDFCNFLFKIFNYGYYNLFKENFIDADIVSYERFEIIRKYIKALGYDVTLIGYDKEIPENNKPQDMQISFKQL